MIETVFTRILGNQFPDGAIRAPRDTYVVLLQLDERGPRDEARPRSDRRRGVARVKGRSIYGDVLGITEGQVNFRPLAAAASTVDHIGARVNAGTGIRCGMW